MTAKQFDTKSIDELTSLLSVDNRLNRIQLFGVSSYINKACHQIDCRSIESVKRMTNQLLSRLNDARSSSDKLTLLLTLRNFKVKQDNRLTRHLMDDSSSIEERQTIVDTIDARLNRNDLLTILTDDQQPCELRTTIVNRFIELNDEQLNQRLIEAYSNSKSKQFKSFVRSKVESLSQSNDPTMNHVNNDLIEGILNTKQNDDQSYGSRNIELTYFNEQLNAGIKFDSDIVYGENQRSSSLMPSQVRMSVSLPIYNSKYNLFEVRLTQLNSLNLNQLNALKDVKTLDQFVNEMRRIVKSSKCKAIVLINENVAMQLDDSMELTVPQFDWRSFDSLIQMNNLNIEMSTPSLSGLKHKIQMKLNSLFALKSSHQWTSDRFELNLAPAIRFNGKLNFKTDLMPSRDGKSIELTTSSEPVIRLSGQRTNGKFNVKLSFPRSNQMNLFKFKLGTNTHSQSHSSQSSHPTCTLKGAHLLGHQLCVTQRWTSNLIEAQVFVQKTDENLNEFQLQVERSSNKLKFTVESPNSSIKRRVRASIEKYDDQLNAEFEFGPHSYNWRSKFDIRSPNKMLMTSLRRNNVELFKAQMKVDQQTFGRRIEIRPKLELQIGQQQLINSNARIQIEQTNGRKTNLKWELSDQQWDGQVKGTFAREYNDLNGEFKWAIHLIGQLKENEVKLVNLIERQSKRWQHDFAVELNKQKLIQTQFKAQDSSQGKSLTKRSLNLDVKSDVNQDVNFNVHFDVVDKQQFSGRQFESEFIVNRINNMKVFKLKQQIDKQSNQLQGQIDIEMPYAGLNYQIKLDSSKQSNQQFKVELKGNDLNGNKKNDVRAAVELKQTKLTQNYVKMQFACAILWRQQQIEFTDELKQINSHEFNGQSNLHVNKRAILDVNYNYKVKPKQNQYEAEVQVKRHLPSGQVKQYKTFAQINYSQNEFNLKSNFKSQQNVVLYDVVARVNRLKRTLKFELTNEQQDKRVKLDVNPNEVIALVVTPSGTQHKTEIDLNEKRLNSQTKLNGKFVDLKGEFKVKRGHIEMQTNDLTGQIEWEQNKRMNFDMKSSRLNHKTTVRRTNDDISIESECQYDGRSIWDVKSNVNLDVLNGRSFITANVNKVNQMAFEMHKKQYKFNMKTPSYDNENSMSMRDNEFALKSHLKDRNNANVWRVNLADNNQLNEFNLNLFDSKLNSKFEWQKQAKQWINELQYKLSDSHSISHSNQWNQRQFKTETQSNGKRLFGGEWNGRDNGYDMDVKVQNDKQLRVQFTDDRSSPKQLRIELSDEASGLTHSSVFSHNVDNNKLHLNSLTQRKTKPILSIELSFEPKMSDSKLLIEMPSKQYKLDVSVLDGRQLRCDLQSKQLKSTNKLSIENEKIEFQSKTTDKRTTNELLAMNGRVQRRGRREGQLNVNVYDGKHFIELHFNKNTLKCNGKWNDYHVDSSIQSNNNQLIDLKSQIRSSKQSIAKLTVSLMDQFDERKNQISVEYSKGFIHFDVNNKMIELKLKCNKITHQTVVNVQREKSQFKIESQTQRNDKNELDMFVDVNPDVRSIIRLTRDVKGHQEAKFEIQMSNQNDEIDSIEWQLKCQKRELEHKTVIKRERQMRDQIKCESSTQISGQTIARFNGITMNQMKTNEFHLKTSKYGQIDLKTDLQSRDRRSIQMRMNQYKFELVKSERQIELHVNDDMNLNVKWNVNQIGWSTKLMNVNANGNIKKHSIKFDSKMNLKSLLNGPHDVTASIKSPSNHIDIKLNHEMTSSNQLNCQFVITQNGQNKLTFKSKTSSSTIEVVLDVNDGQHLIDFYSKHSNINELQSKFNSIFNRKPIFGLSIANVFNGKRIQSELNVNVKNVKRTFKFDKQDDQQIKLAILDGRQSELFELKASKANGKFDLQLDCELIQLRTQIKRNELMVFDIKSSRWTSINYVVKLEKPDQDSLNFHVKNNENKLIELNYVSTERRSSQLLIKLNEKQFVEAQFNRQPNGHFELQTEIEPLKFKFNLNSRKHLNIELTNQITIKLNGDVTSPKRKSIELQIDVLPSDGRQTRFVRVAKSLKTFNLKWSHNNDGREFNHNLDVNFNGKSYSYEIYYLKGKQLKMQLIRPQNKQSNVELTFTRTSIKAQLKLDEQNHIKFDGQLNDERESRCELSVKFDGRKNSIEIQTTKQLRQAKVKLNLNEIKKIQLNVERSQREQRDGRKQTVQIDLFDGQSFDWRLNCQWDTDNVDYSAELLNKLNDKRLNYAIKMIDNQIDIRLNKWHLIGRRINGQHFDGVIIDEQTQQQHKITLKSDGQQCIDGIIESTTEQHIKLCVYKVKQTQQKLFELQWDDGRDDGRDLDVNLEMKSLKSLLLSLNWNTHKLGQLIDSMTRLSHSYSHSHSQQSQFWNELKQVIQVIFDGIEAIIQSIAKSSNQIRRMIEGSFDWMTKWTPKRLFEYLKDCASKWLPHVNVVDYDSVEGRFLVELQSPFKLHSYKSKFFA